MAHFDFDEVIDRKGSKAVKFDGLKERFGREDIIPLWIADMDYKSPPAVTDAIIKRAEHGIFGYGCCCDGYYNSIMSWLNNQHNWSVEKDWITFIPGIVKGIAFTIDCFLKKGDKVIIQPPVYPPFHNVPKLHNYDLVYNPLTLESGKYIMDFDDLKKKIDPACKLLILCNPHNPGGRVWSKEELEIVADICYDNNILVISDEIHADLVYDGHKHTPFASVSEKAKMNSITFMAPSKTFNIAGIVSSFSVIPNPDLRAKFNHYLSCRELSDAHLFAYVATEAAYNFGEEWLKAAKEYMWDNILFVDDYLKRNIPQLKAMIPEASFLIWLDCRELGLSQPELESFFINDAKLALNSGTAFGQEGEGFMRLNIGTQRSVLKQALDNLKQAVEKSKINIFSC